MDVPRSCCGGGGGGRLGLVGGTGGRSVDGIFFGAPLGGGGALDGGAGGPGGRILLDSPLPGTGVLDSAGGAFGGGRGGGGFEMTADGALGL